METADRHGTTAPGGSVVAACRDADLLRVIAAADGDALAAATILAGACGAAGTPYQVSVARTPEAIATRRSAGDPDATTLVVGAPSPDGASVRERPASLAAHEVAADLGAPAPALALAGTIAAGEAPESAAPDLLDRAGATRRPGVVAPVTDPADALAHTTLAHAPFSGDEGATRSAVEGIGDPDPDDDADRRRLASLLAVEAVGEAPPRAATAIERALQPRVVDGPVAALGGYADVLTALSRAAPGLGVALGLGADTGPALDAWREHARAVHGAVRDAETARYDGLLIAEVDGPIRPTARLLRDFASPEPAALAVGDGRAALATTDGADALANAAEAVGGTALVRDDIGEATLEPGRENDLVDALLEAR